MNVYFPFEGKARELSARIYFCVEAANRGHKAYFGHKTDIFPLIPKLKPGIFFHKSIQKRKIAQIEQLRELGHFNAAIDEEGLCVLNETIYFDYRLTKKNLSSLDVFFTWGENHKKLILKKYPDLNTKLKCAGNPRIDVSKNINIFMEKAKKINYKYPKFILFATKFVTSNFVPRGANSYREMAKWNLPEMSKKVFEELKENEDWDRKNRILFTEAIKECARKFPNMTMVIRPHPGEDRKLWLDLAKGIETKNVVCENPVDSILPWIIACNKLVSFNCTTLLDAALISNKAINYIPISNVKGEYKVFQSCSEIARNKDQLFKLIQNQPEISFQRKEMKEYIHNWEESSFCDYSMNFIENRVDPNNYSQLNSRLNPFIFFIKKNIHKFKKFYSLYFGKGQRRRKIYKQKFPGLNLKEVRKIHKSIKISLGTKISEPWPGVFLVEKI